MKNLYKILILLTGFILSPCYAVATHHQCDAPFELSTIGSQIVDQCGNKIKLKSVSWYGAHETPQVPGGLDKQPMQNIVNLIKAGGFNSVRFTFSNQMLHDTHSVDPNRIAANPELINKTPLQVFDIAVKMLTDAGIIVILNNHTTTSEWCCAYDFNGLWHHPRYQSTAQWLNDWVMMVTRYRHNPLVAGADLRNEVRTGRYRDTYIPVNPNWGWGDENDWKLAATQAGNIIHEVNPHLLIIVEGINWTGIPMVNGYRPMLTPVKNNPLILNHSNKLVYEVHIYGYTGPTHTGDDASSRGQKHYRDFDETALKTVLDQQFGYVLENNRDYTAPVWLGEFGVGYRSANEKDKLWFQRMVGYMLEKDLGWSFWALNPVRADGTIEEFGLLTDDWSAYREDWRSPWIRRLLKG
ncbi:MAG: hypothetical protein A3E83_00730 [Gammaproteobacteria bacterium RIFCSPHIGHO2_12_FULL_41_20]|nr:MAG: hypothetical protein A3E83_00730 [Gammaproteobacteria bacterium RIFCSPHIGHO2_12_FULL_41_20]